MTMAPSMVRWGAAVCALLTIGGRHVAAQPASAPPRREMPITGTTGTFDRLVSLPAGAARDIVVSDVVGVAAVSHPVVLKPTGQNPTGLAPHVSLYRLKADGLADG